MNREIKNVFNDLSQSIQLNREIDTGCVENARFPVEVLVISSEFWPEDVFDEMETFLAKNVPKKIKNCLESFENLFKIAKVDFLIFLIKNIF